MSFTEKFDVVIVGAGIIGLAHAWAASRLGKRVAVIERDARAVGASIRNFGFITVTGQERGEHWHRALRSSARWQELGAQGVVDIVQRGFVVVAQRPQASAVLEELMATEMGEQLELLSPLAARERFPTLTPHQLDSMLFSPHEVRVESRDALPQLARWLEQAHQVRFYWSTLAQEPVPGGVRTNRGNIGAEALIICPNTELKALYPERLQALGIRHCQLHMLRVEPEQSSFELPGALMSDLSLVRYEGFAEMTAARALRQVLEREQADYLAHGIHLIASQSRDGSLLLGDSHEYGETLGPFRDEYIDQLIMDEFKRATGLPSIRVRERWLGVYASLPDRRFVVDEPDSTTRIVIVTGGTGASTGFAIAEDVIAQLFG